MKRKISAGLFMTVISIIAAVISFIYYMVNCNTAYFKNAGISPVVAGCIMVAIALQAVLIIIGMKGQPMWADILPIVVSTLLMFATANFISIRAVPFATIITFENSAKNMADLSSAIIGIAACLVATLVSIVAAFFDITKEQA
jgi:hypothetical protein